MFTRSMLKRMYPSQLPNNAFQRTVQQRRFACCWPAAEGKRSAPEETGSLGQGVYVVLRASPMLLRIHVQRGLATRTIMLLVRLTTRPERWYSLQHEGSRTPADTYCLLGDCIR